MLRTGVEVGEPGARIQTSRARTLQLEHIVIPLSVIEGGGA